MTGPPGPAPAGDSDVGTPAAGLAPAGPATSGTLAAFRAPGYTALWLSTTIAAFGHAVGFVAIGWLTLQVSDSPLAVGAAFAVRLVPSLVLGIPLGALVDRVDRGRLLLAVNLAGVAPLVAAAGLIGTGSGAADLTLLLALSLALGVVDTIRGLTTTAYAFDLAGPEGATNAIALANLGGFLLGVVGSPAGGIVLDGSGPAGTFLLAAGAGAIAGAVIAPARRRPLGGHRVARSADLRSSMTLITRNRAVALLALIVVVQEVFGFSAATLFPTFARDVLRSDAGGLGLLLAARYVGSIAALLLVARVVRGSGGGGAILFTTFALGAGLAGFALSTSFALSALLLVAVGMASAAVDSLVQARIQHVVPDEQRGSAVGIWYFAVGFGPIGTLALGAAAAAVGAPLALVVSGGILAAFAAALALLPRVRQAT